MYLVFRVDLSKVGSFIMTTCLCLIPRFIKTMVTCIIQIHKKSNLPLTNNTNDFIFAFLPGDKFRAGDFETTPFDILVVLSILTTGILIQFQIQK